MKSLRKIAEEILENHVQELQYIKDPEERNKEFLCYVYKEKYYIYFNTNGIVMLSYLIEKEKKDYNEYIPTSSNKIRQIIDSIKDKQKQGEDIQEKIIYEIEKELGV